MSYVLLLSDVYFMSTACGRPQGEGVRLMWTLEGGQKPDFLWTS